VHGDISLPPAVVASPLFESECAAASNGTLGNAAFERADTQRRARFFWCALTPYVGEANETAAEFARVMRAKQKLADRLLALGVDVNYRDDSGTTLLMSVVTAKVPDAWKLRVVNRLLGAGADPNARNVHGMSAFDLAQVRLPQNLEALRKRLGAPN
jgi:ankyrin repeat protein